MCQQVTLRVSPYHQLHGKKKSSHEQHVQKANLWVWNFAFPFSLAEQTFGTLYRFLTSNKYSHSSSTWFNTERCLDEHTVICHISLCLEAEIFWFIRYSTSILLVFCKSFNKDILGSIWRLAAQSWRCTRDPSNGCCKCSIKSIAAAGRGKSPVGRPTSSSPLSGGGSIPSGGPCRGSRGSQELEWQQSHSLPLTHLLQSQRQVALSPPAHPFAQSTRAWNMAWGMEEIVPRAESQHQRQQLSTRLGQNLSWVCHKTQEWNWVGWDWFRPRTGKGWQF